MVNFFQRLYQNKKIQKPYRFVVIYNGTLYVNVGDDSKEKLTQ